MKATSSSVPIAFVDEGKLDQNELWRCVETGERPLGVMWEDNAARLFAVLEWACPPRDTAEPEYLNWANMTREFRMAELAIRPPSKLSSRAFFRDLQPYVCEVPEQRDGWSIIGKIEAAKQIAKTFIDAAVILQERHKIENATRHHYTRRLDTTSSHCSRCCMEQSQPFQTRRQVAQAVVPGRSRPARGDQSAFTQ